MWDMFSWLHCNGRLRQPYSAFKCSKYKVFVHLLKVLWSNLNLSLGTEYEICKFSKKINVPDEALNRNIRHG